MDFLTDSILIVAHPDDDILWFSSIIGKTQKTIFCFSESPLDKNMGNARSKTIADYPLKNIESLNITEPNAFGKANWPHPSYTKCGLALNEKSETNYRRCFDDLSQKLEPIVSDTKNVFTHNPWGEYGHEEHILVYSVIKNLQNKYGFDIWFSNYCSNVSVDLLFRFINGFNYDYVTLPTNVKLAEEITEIYKKHNCWTWYSDYQWFKEESFMRDQQLTNNLAYGHIFPINLLKIHIDHTPKEIEGERIFSKFFRKTKKLVSKKR